ncbi:MAG: S8 family serine peptidase [Alphaproteobacteria bacterium]|nr:S8 family serine peptidase [Alphaproteobacteria bacterium]
MSIIVARLRLAVAVALAALAAGCGGGGGGASATGSGGGSGPSAPRSCVDRPASGYAGDCEYRRTWGLAAVKAAAAYERIAARDGAGTAPGDGARVAVIDDGIDDGHWEFDSSIVTKTGDTDTDKEHGTPVASVIAARRDQPFPSYADLPRIRQADFHGIAWGIDSLEMRAVPLGTTDPNLNYVGTPVADVDDRVDELADQFSALTTSPDFVNMSFSVRGLIENYVGETFGPLYDPAIQTLAQTGTPTGKTILIVAAGNHNGRKCESPEPNCVGGRLDATSPALYAGLPVLETSLRTHVVAVVATDSGGRIASFSNRCGIAAKWCIAAPGQGIRVATFEEGSEPGQIFRGYGTWNGTSFAAPFVTGGLAVMKHWFRSQMANEELLTRLYETARVTPDSVPSGGSCPDYLDLDGDLSDCELSSILGRGLMDLDAATAPVGMMSFVMGNQVVNGGPPAQFSQISPGNAMGNGMRRSLAGQQIALFDTLNAPFWVDAGHFVREPAPAGLATRLYRWLAKRDGDGAGAIVSREGETALAEGAGPAGSGLQFGFGTTGTGHMSLAPHTATAKARLGNTVLAAFASAGSGGEAGVRTMEGDTHGITLAWQPPHAPAGLHAGWIRETDALFGSSAKGAFGRLSSSLNFVGASGAFDADGWRFDLAAEFGRATPDAADGMLADGGKSAFSSAFSAEAARPLANGTLRLSVQQPLRVENGSLRLSLPVGRTPEGTVQRRRVPVGLEPSGRQIDFGIDWMEEFSPDAVWRVGAVLSRQPGHNAGRGAEAILLAGLRIGL